MNNKTKGFTLIELLFVVAIISIIAFALTHPYVLFLLLVVIVVYKKYKKKVRE